MEEDNLPDNKETKSCVKVGGKTSSLGGKLKLASSPLAAPAASVRRQRLSPHNPPTEGTKKTVHFDAKLEEGEKLKRGLKKWRSGSSLAVGGTVSGDDDYRTDNQENDARVGTEKKGVKVGASGLRKRSYSFSDGPIKHPSLPVKRWKPGGRSTGGRGGRVGGGPGGGGKSVSGASGVTSGTKNVLPSKFLLGGNINDPLNLNSLNDERISRMVNAVTPESSPLPTPKHRKAEYKIEVLIPPNISDPLNLNAEDDSDYEAKLISPVVKKKKVRHRKRPKKPIMSVDLANLPGPKPENEEGIEGDVSDTDDEVTVSIPPSIPSVLNRRVNSDDEDSLDTTDEVEKEEIVEPINMEIVEKEDSGPLLAVVPQKIVPNGEEVKVEYKDVKSTDEVKADESLTVTKIELVIKVEKKKPKTHIRNKIKGKNDKFQYGNYNQYYGYRNPGQTEDGRLQFFKKNWFEDKEVLDIGCNIGHITMSVAKEFGPEKITGVDIDKSLIEIAKKNIRFYLDTQPEGKTKYPRSCPQTFGPLNPGAGPSSRQSPKSPVGQSSKFPNNVLFCEGNYVLDCDELLEMVVPEFDTILLLSTTKWIHLNFGDEGIKRVFLRVYAQLKPGGTFILESQSFSGYRKKKKLTPTIFNNFKDIKLKPENFADFLIHEVGFCRSEVVALPPHPSKGFQRPLQVFTKNPPSSNISASTTPYSFGLSPHCYNPSFTPFYGKITPGYTPRYSQTPVHVDPAPAALLPTPLYSGPTPPMYYGPTPGGYSANSTPSHSTPGYRTPESLQPPASISPHLDRPGFTPGYTPSYTPAHAHYSPGNTPNYSPGNATPAPNYSPGNATPAPTYSPSTPDPPCYSPSAGTSYSPAPNYSPSTGYSPSYSPVPLYSPGNATPRYLPKEPAYSPSIQGPEVTGNTTPHPGNSSPLDSSPGPRYSWAGGVPGSGGNTPQHGVPLTGSGTPNYGGAGGGATPRSDGTGQNTPAGSEGSGQNTPKGEVSGGTTPQQDRNTPKPGELTPQHVGPITNGEDVLQKLTEPIVDAAGCREKESEAPGKKEKKPEAKISKEREAEAAVSKEKKLEATVSKEKKSEAAGKKEKEPEAKRSEEKESEEAVNKEKESNEAGNRENDSEVIESKEKEFKAAENKEKEPTAAGSKENEYKAAESLEEESIVKSPQTIVKSKQTYTTEAGRKEKDCEGTGSQKNDIEAAVSKDELIAAGSKEKEAEGRNKKYSEEARRKEESKEVGVKERESKAMVSIEHESKVLVSQAKESRAAGSKEEESKAAGTKVKEFKLAGSLDEELKVKGCKEKESEAIGSNEREPEAKGSQEKESKEERSSKKEFKGTSPKKIVESKNDNGATKLSSPLRTQTLTRQTRNKDKFKGKECAKKDSTGS